MQKSNKDHTNGHTHYQSKHSSWLPTWAKPTTWYWLISLISLKWAAESKQAGLILSDITVMCLFPHYLIPASNPCLGNEVEAESRRPTDGKVKSPCHMPHKWTLKHACVHRKRYIWKIWQIGKIVVLGKNGGWALGWKEEALHLSPSMYELENFLFFLQFKN
jgi:hypothetical protein